MDEGERFEPHYPLETERLVLRPFRSDDLDALAAIHSNPVVARYNYWEPRSLEEVHAVLAWKIGETSVSAEGDRLSLAVFLPDADEVIGDCVLHWTSNKHSQGELGFLFNPLYHGHGYATEAARAMLGLAFDGMRLHRVVGRLEARNAASAGVLERLGMRREAHLVENECVKGEWQSEMVYAMLELEWQQGDRSGVPLGDGRGGRTARPGRTSEA